MKVNLKRFYSVNKVFLFMLGLKCGTTQDVPAEFYYGTEVIKREREKDI